MKTLSKTASCLVLPIVMLTGCGSSPQAASKEPPKETGPASLARRAAGPDSGVVLACPGRIEGRSEAIEVGAGADGVVKAVYVQEGQEVRKGQTLAEIDCSDLWGTYKSANSDVDTLRQVRTRLIRGSREEERRMAAQKTVAARSVLERARLHLERMKGLYEKQDIAKASVDDAHRDYDVSEANLRGAVQHEQLVNAPPLPEEIAKADSEIAAGESRIRVIAEKMQKCQVRAPIDGTILRLLLRKGESFSMITPRPLFTIADLSVRRVRAEVDERDVLKVRTGQKVVIFSEARPDFKVGGVVERLASAMGRKKILTGDPSEKADVDVLEAMIDLEQNTNHLPVGMRVVVQFLR